MASDSKEVVTDISPFMKVYKDGTVERLCGSPYISPSPDDPITGTSSKDVTISPQISARLYLPRITDPNQKLPILVYFHGGGFCVESAFSFFNHRYMNLIVSEASALAVSVEYRLAPEYPVPAAYEDSWAALQWVASHVNNSAINKEPWLINHGNLNKLYIGGDASGANIVHNIAMRAGIESLYGDIKIIGAFLSQPYFLGSNSTSNSCNIERQTRLSNEIWMLAYPSAPGGIDNPMINPLSDDAPSLSRLGCSRLFVSVAEKDATRERVILYVEAVKKSGWEGEVELFEVEGKDHGFHILNPEDEEAKILNRLLASFLMLRGFSGDHYENNQMIDPLADDAPNLSQIMCLRLLICVSEKDELRERTGLCVQALKKVVDFCTSHKLILCIWVIKLSTISTDCLHFLSSKFYCYRNIIL